MVEQLPGKLFRCQLLLHECFILFSFKCFSVSTQIGLLGYPEVALTEPQIDRCLEAYLIWLLGKTMFTENHVDTISARYITIAQEIADARAPQDIRARSFGSAVLAATYRGMCKSCQLNTRGSALLGCPLLLQLWSWERFPIGRPYVGIEVPWEAELFDADRIDMPTFGTMWARRVVCSSFLPFQFQAS